MSARYLLVMPITMCLFAGNDGADAQDAHLIDRPAWEVIMPNHHGDAMTELMYRWHKETGRAKTVTATGHVIGATYATATRTYTVVGTATVWMCAPDRATRIVWDTGERDFLQRPCTDIPIAFAEAAAA